MLRARHTTAGIPEFRKLRIDFCKEIGHSAPTVAYRDGHRNQHRRARAASALRSVVALGHSHDAEGELHGMWRPTGQPGLWFHAGGLAQCRIFSKVLALQIKARELGMVA